MTPYLGTIILGDPLSRELCYLFWPPIYTSTILFLNGTILFFNGKRKRGRPPTSWLKDIKSSTGMTLQEAVRAAEDRERWRRIVKTTASHNATSDWREREREIYSSFHHHLLFFSPGLGNNFVQIPQFLQFSGGFWRLGKFYVYVISKILGRLLNQYPLIKNQSINQTNKQTKKTNLWGLFIRKNLPRTEAKNTLLPEKIRRRMWPPFYVNGGGGGGVAEWGFHYTWLSSPSVINMPKKSTAQSGETGIRATAAGYAMKARPKPERKEINFLKGSL